MNKSEKEHLCSKIRQIAERKSVKEKVKQPGFNYAVGEAARMGTLKVLPMGVLATHVMAQFAARYRNCELRFDQVFAPPAEYTRQLKAYEHDQEFVKRKNAPLLEKMHDLIDRIMLGVVKNPEAALAEAEGWKL